MLLLLLRSWDFVSRSVARTLSHPFLPCSAADSESSAVGGAAGALSLGSGINAVCSLSWSCSGRRLLVGHVDGLLCVWDVLQARLDSALQMPSGVKAAVFHPRRSSECLVCLQDGEPLVLPLSRSAAAVSSVSPLSSQPARSLSGAALLPDAKRAESLSVAIYDRDGQHILAGGSRGSLLVLSSSSLSLLAAHPATGRGGQAVLGMSASADGRFLILNSADRSIKLWECGNWQALTQTQPRPASVFPQLVHVHDHSDVVNRVSWKRCCFSGSSGGYVLAGCGERSSHAVYIWSRAEELVKVLHGATEGLLDLCCHPLHPILLTCCTAGRCYVWAKQAHSKEELYAFAPDFQLLTDNEEYREQEDEFDLKLIPRPASTAQQHDSSEGGAAAAAAAAGARGEAELDICSPEAAAPDDWNEDGEQPLISLPIDWEHVKGSARQQQQQRRQQAAPHLPQPMQPA